MTSSNLRQPQLLTVTDQWRQSCQKCTRSTYLITGNIAYIDLPRMSSSQLFFLAKFLELYSFLRKTVTSSSAVWWVFLQKNSGCSEFRFNLFHRNKIPAIVNKSFMMICFINNRIQGAITKVEQHWENKNGFQEFTCRDRRLSRSQW